MSGIRFTTERADDKDGFGYFAIFASGGRNGANQIGNVVAAPAEADAFEAMVRSHAGVCDALEGMVAEYEVMAEDTYAIPGEHPSKWKEWWARNDPSGHAKARAARKLLALARPPVVDAMPEGGE